MEDDSESTASNAPSTEAQASAGETEESVMIKPVVIKATTTDEHSTQDADEDEGEDAAASAESDKNDDDEETGDDEDNKEGTDVEDNKEDTGDEVKKEGEDDEDSKEGKDVEDKKEGKDDDEAEVKMEVDETDGSDVESFELTGELNAESSEPTGELNTEATEEKLADDVIDVIDDDDDDDDDDDSVIEVDPPADEPKDAQAQREKTRSSLTGRSGMKVSRSLHDAPLAMNMGKRGSLNFPLGFKQETLINDELHQLLDTSYQKSKIIVKPAGRRKAHHQRKSMSDIYVQDLWASAGPYDSDDEEDPAAAESGAGAAGGRRALPGMGAPRMGFGLPPIGAGGLSGLKSGLGGARNRAPTVGGVGAVRELSIKLRSRASKDQPDSAPANNPAFGNVRLKQSDNRPSTAPAKSDSLTAAGSTASEPSGQAKNPFEGVLTRNGSRKVSKSPAASSSAGKKDNDCSSPPVGKQDSAGKGNPFEGVLRKSQRRSEGKRSDSRAEDSRSQQLSPFGPRIKSASPARALQEDRAADNRNGSTSPFAKFGARTRSSNGLNSSSSNSDVTTRTGRAEAKPSEPEDFVPKFGRPSDIKRKSSTPLTSPLPSTRKQSWSKGSNDSTSSYSRSDSKPRDDEVPEWKKKLKSKSSERSNSVEPKKPQAQSDPSVLEFQRFALRKTGGGK